MIHIILVTNIYILEESKCPIEECRSCLQFHVNELTPELINLRISTESTSNCWIAFVKIMCPHIQARVRVCCSIAGRCGIRWHKGKIGNCRQPCPKDPVPILEIYMVKVVNGKYSEAYHMKNIYILYKSNTKDLLTTYESLNTKTREDLGKPLQTIPYLMAPIGKHNILTTNPITPMRTTVGPQRTRSCMRRNVKKTYTSPVCKSSRNKTTMVSQGRICKRKCHRIRIMRLEQELQVLRKENRQLRTNIIYQ